MSKDEIRFSKPVEVVPANWRVEAEMPIWRVVADLGVSPAEVDTWTIDQVLDANEFLDVRADATESLRRAEEEHAAKVARNQADANKPVHRPRARSMRTR